ncbi:MAG: hypothetical protein ABGX22_02565 [Pirellulaceae bacterium]
MELLHRQVARARRRMILEQFFRIATWSLFGCLLIALVGLAIPKIWHIEVASEVWNGAWLGGAVTLALVFAISWTYIARRSSLDAALEIDRRYQLRERVSSALSLPSSELETDVGDALTRDAVRRIERIDVSERFQVKAGWISALPVLPVVMAILLLLLPNVDSKKSTAKANQARKVEVKKIQDRSRDLERSLRKTADKLAEKGLKDAEALLRDLEKAARELSQKSDIDRKKAMIKINEMAKKLEDRRKKMGGADQLKAKLEKLSDVQSGPADRLAKAMKKGDFKTAIEELNKLKDKLETGELSQEEKENLAKNMDQIKDKLDEMKRDYEQAIRDLEEQIKQKQAAGDNKAVNELQNKLDQLNQMSEQMNQMDQLAQKMGECAQCLKQGNSAAAGQKLSELMDGLQSLQDQLDELETLNEALDQLMAGKDMMSEGMDGLDGMSLGGMGSGQGDFPGNGNGEGQGQGARGEDRGDTSAYDSKVASKIQKGQAVIAGKVDGPNIAGTAYESVKEAMIRDSSKNSDPLTDQKLPKDQRDHAREYFKRYQPE